MTTYSPRPRAQSASAELPSIDDLDAAICKLARQMNAETYQLLMLVRDFDDRLGWAKWSFRNCAEWLAWRCGLSLSAARERVRTAHALRTLPAISAGFADGRLSYSKVRALTRVATHHDEKTLVAYALQAAAVQVEERCRQMRNGRPESVTSAWHAWERRALTLRRDQARGTMVFSVEVPLEDGELIAKALERAVEAGEVAMGYEFASKTASTSAPPSVRDSVEASSSASNGWLAQQADALIAIAKAYLAGGAEASGEALKSVSTADQYQVVVHVDEKSLRGGISVDNSGRAGGQSDLPIETVKRLTCDGSVVTVVEDDHGTPLDVGRKQRTVSTALKRALWARDRGCTFPGCHNTRYVDAHHVHHWADGGETSLPNLMLLCSYHHRLLHEGGFRIRRAEGASYFERPDGRVIPRCGYRLEDMLDDFASAPSAEVRETAEIYEFRAPIPPPARPQTSHRRDSAILTFY